METSREISPLCDCCKLNRAEFKDYRELEECGRAGLDKFLVCGNCLHLSNYWFLKLMNAKYPRGKKNIVGKILEGGGWRSWIIE